jgi:hypothetical protein
MRDSVPWLWTEILCEKIGMWILVQGVSKRAWKLWKLIQIFSEDVYSVINCHDVAKHTEFYLVQLHFNVTSTGNAGCLKMSFTMVLQMLLCPFSVNVSVTLATQQYLEYIWNTAVKLFLKHPV